jgi:hypothetical protein
MPQPKAKASGSAFGEARQRSLLPGSHGFYQCSPSSGPRHHCTFVCRRQTTAEESLPAPISKKNKCLPSKNQSHVGESPYVGNQNCCFRKSNETNRRQGAPLDHIESSMTANSSYKPTKRPGLAGNRAKSWEERYLSECFKSVTQGAVRRIPPRMSVGDREQPKLSFPCNTERAGS